MYYVAQGIGMVAFLVAAWSFQQNSQKRIVYFQLISTTLFAVHFAMLGVMTGAVLNMIGVFRAAIFSQKDKAWAKNKAWLAFFVVLCIAAGILTWKNWLSILPLIGMIFTTVAFWVEDPKMVRRLSFPSSPCWLIYNAASHSWAGVLTELFIMTSILIATFRYEWLPKLREKRSVKK